VGVGQVVERDVGERTGLDQRGSQPGWGEAFRYAAALVLGVRVALGLVMILGLGMFPHGARVDRFGRVPPTGLSMLWTDWEHWDAFYYLRIAEGGYSSPDPPSAWFPVYPFTTWLLRPVVGGSTLGAALLASTVALLVALAILYRLTADEFDRHAARRSVLYLAISPAALFFFAPYAESLFLLLAVATFWALRRQHFLVAGLLAGVASGTRSVGVLLALPIAVEVLRALRAAKDPPARWRTLAAGLGGLLLAPAGLLAYLGYWQLRTGNGLLVLQVQRTNWGHQPTLPWRTLREGLRRGTTGFGVPESGIAQIELLVTLVTLALLVWVIARTPAPYALWSLVMVAFPLSTAIPGLELEASPRYFLVVFPLAWGMARFSDRFRAHTAIVGVSAGLLAVLTVFFAGGYRFL
jgi:hypothetical protein